MYVKMPKLCNYENCRNRATNNCCAKHKNFIDHPANHPIENPVDYLIKCIIKTCNEKPIRIFKKYCANCYFREFPNDPLTFQMRFKTKEQAVKEFINSRFDGFNREGIMKIGDVMLVVNFCKTSYDYLKEKYISIRFNTDKYVDAISKKMVNPMLYTRLPVLEREINKQIERILNCNVDKSETVELFVS
jgi:hypothetical protein